MTAKTSAKWVWALLEEQPDLMERLKRVAHAEGRTRNWREYVAEIFERQLRVLLGDEYLSTKEAAVALNVSRCTIKRYLAAGRFPHAKWINARVVKIPRRDLDALLRNPLAGDDRLFYGPQS
jgi:excisionase family DNA binding protein